MKKVLVLQAYTMASVIYRDLIEDKDTEVLYVNKNDVGRIARIIRGAHTSIRATQLGELPLKRLWYHKILLDTYTKDCVYIFQLDSAMRVGLSNLQYLQQKMKANNILILLDSVNAHSWTMKYARPYIFSKVWSEIASFDLEDCKKYGFTYIGYSYYSKLPLKNKYKAEIDLYYAGRIKNEDSRFDNLKDIINRGKNRVNSKFVITGIKDKSVKIAGVLIYNENLPYETILDDVIKSNCILELIQPGQSNQTVRYFEAVCYNKKLLTNNPNLQSLPFYNPEFMKYFETASDIDFEWVGQRDNINYHYNNFFSPLKIYETLGI